MKRATLLLIALAVLSVASAEASPFLDTFSSDTTANYTMDDIYGAGTSTKTWVPGFFQMYSSNTTVEGFYPIGATRAPQEAVSVTIDSMASAGTGWRSTGVIVSESRPTNLFTANIYRMFLNRESGSGNTYWPEVRTKNNTTIYTGSITSLPVTLTIGRDGGDYTFLVNGTEVYRDNPTARFGAGVELPHFGMINSAAGSTSLTANVDTLDVRLSPQRRPLGVNALVWSEDFAGDLSGFSERKMWRDGNGDGGPADSAVTWTAANNVLQVRKSNVSAPDRGDILWQTQRLFEGDGRLEVRVTGDTNSSTWFSKGLFLADDLDYRSSYGASPVLHNAYEFQLVDGELRVRRTVDGVTVSPGWGTDGIIGRLTGLGNNPSTPYYLDIVRQGQQYSFFFDRDAEGPLMPELVATDVRSLDLKYFGIALGAAAGVSSTLDVDHIRIYVPEPAAWVLAFSGLGILAAGRRARRT